MEFFLPIAPSTITSQAKGLFVDKAGKPRLYTKPRVKDASAIYESELAKHRPEQPLQGAVRLMIFFLFPLRKVDKWHGEIIPHVQKPDADNAAKLFIDAMTAQGYWGDDCQVADLTVRKYRSVDIGVYVKVSEL